jgi:2-keto-4-pentenoate hydratase
MHTDSTSAARLLWAARQQGRTAPAPQLADADAAYAVQQAVAEAGGWWNGGAPRHWKSGGASPQALQTHAALPPGGVFDSPADLRGMAFHLRGIEAEVAVRLGRPVDAAQAATLDRDGAAALVDALCVSIEVVDSRWNEGLQAPAWARLADLQSHGALVLGAWQPFVDRPWMQQAVQVQIGSQPPQRFVGTHSFGDPLAVLPGWLRHATHKGVTLPAGTVLTTGTWCGLLMAQAGDAVDVRFDGIGQAQLQF